MLTYLSPDFATGCTLALSKHGVAVLTMSLKLRGFCLYVVGQQRADRRLPRWHTTNEEWLTTRCQLAKQARPPTSEHLARKTAPSVALSLTAADSSELVTSSTISFPLCPLLSPKKNEKHTERKAAPDTGEWRSARALLSAMAVPASPARDATAP